MGVFILKIPSPLIEIGLAKSMLCMTGYLKSIQLEDEYSHDSKTWLSISFALLLILAREHCRHPKLQERFVTCTYRGAI